MSLSTRNFFVLIVLAAAGFTSAVAQVPEKVTRGMVKAVRTAPKNIVKGALSPAQLHMLQSQHQMLEETRRAIKQNPGWVFSPQFEIPVKNLKELGLTLPELPKITAPALEKAIFRKQLEQLLYQESVALGDLINLTPRPQPSSKSFEITPKQLFLANAHSREGFDLMLSSVEPNLLWGTPNWNEVRVKPLEFDKTLRRCNQMVLEMASVEMITLADALNYILYDTSLRPAEQQALMTAMAESSELLSFDFVRIYMQIFHRIPVVEPTDDTARTATDAMGRYAQTVQIKLIKELEEAGFWTPQQFEAFAELSVFLPSEQVKAVLGALTYLEPSAALWLMEHPLDEPLSKKLLGRVEMLRSQQAARWPDGKILPKESVQSLVGRFKFKRIEALQARVGLLQQRYMELIDKQDSANRAVQILAHRPVAGTATAEDMRERLAVEAFISARLARVAALMDQTKAAIDEIEEELNALL